MAGNNTVGNEEFNEPAAPRGPGGTPYGRDVAGGIVSYLDWPNESSDGAINWTPREWLIGRDKRQSPRNVRAGWGRLAVTILTGILLPYGLQCTLY